MEDPVVELGLLRRRPHEVEPQQRQRPPLQQPESRRKPEARHPLRHDRRPQQELQALE